MLHHIKPTTEISVINAKWPAGFRLIRALTDQDLAAYQEISLSLSSVMKLVITWQLLFGAITTGCELHSHWSLYHEEPARIGLLVEETANTSRGCPALGLQGYLCLFWVPYKMIISHTISHWSPSSPSMLTPLSLLNPSLCAQLFLPSVIFQGHTVVCNCPSSGLTRQMIYRADQCWKKTGGLPLQKISKNYEATKSRALNQAWGPLAAQSVHSKSPAMWGQKSAHWPSAQERREPSVCDPLACHKQGMGSHPWLSPTGPRISPTPHKRNR